MTNKRLSRSFVWATLCLLASTPAWALYKVVGPDGSVTYTDRPPSDAKAAQPLNTGASAASANAGLPYELQQVVARYPVVFYSNDRCSPCDAARQFLKQRGIPFTEKTVNTSDDLRAYKALTGSDQMPTVSIGSQQLHGFAQGEWSDYLNAAGYPAQSILTGTYKAPAPTPLTSPRREPETPPADQPVRTPPPTAPSAPPAGNAPPGFQF
ncbi:MAG: glutaredoxin family protein [Burkholderiales bacterium]|nr:glutaredoxin family protein [Burkholderiales bacterium]HET8693257.1 glutaredoxin family protein [Aquabacterium sp.]